MTNGEIKLPDEFASAMQQRRGGGEGDFAGRIRVG